MNQIDLQWAARALRLHIQTELDSGMDRSSVVPMMVAYFRLSAFIDGRDAVTLAEADAVPESELREAEQAGIGWPEWAAGHEVLRWRAIHAGRQRRDADLQRADALAGQLMREGSMLRAINSEGVSTVRSNPALAEFQALCDRLGPVMFSTRESGAPTIVPIA